MPARDEDDFCTPKAGRPTKWEDAYVGIAEKASLLGLTDDEIADVLGVSVRTLHYWKYDHPELADALRTGKERADERVERSLYQRATGYNITEQQAVKVKLGQYEEKVGVVDVEKHVPASDTAAIFWLKNRRKADWRDKHEVEHSGETTTHVNLSSLTPEQLEAIASINLAGE